MDRAGSMKSRNLCTHLHAKNVGPSKCISSTKKQRSGSRCIFFPSLTGFSRLSVVHRGERPLKAARMRLLQHERHSWAEGGFKDSPFLCEPAIRSSIHEIFPLIQLFNRPFVDPFIIPFTSVFDACAALFRGRKPGQDV